MNQTYADKVARAKAQVLALRIKELNECLDRLGLRKAGRKTDLSNRLLESLDEAGLQATATQNPARLDYAARLIEDCYERVIRDGGRPMHYVPPGAPAPPPPAPMPAPPPANGNGRLHPHVVPAPPPPVAHAAAPAHPHPPGLGGPPRPLANGVHAPGAANGVLYGNGVAAHGHAAGNPHPAGGAALAGTRMVRCLCASGVERPGMVQCTQCKSWQHSECMALPALAPGQQRPTHFCERCRAERCDPYWQVVESSVMLPGRLMPTGKSATMGTKMEPVLHLERTFLVNPSQYDLFKRRANQYRLQLVCLKLNDSVAFRYHWPTGCDVRLNGQQYRVYSRSAHVKMGANQRDDAANVSILSHPPGKQNKLSVQAIDVGSYVVMLQLAKLRTMAEIKQLMMDPETLEQATQRIKQQLDHGGDEEAELQVSKTLQSLRCPLSGARIKTPARFVDVPGMSCFDLDSFLSMVEKSRRWQCPHSMRNSCVQQLQVDTYMVTLLSGLGGWPELTEVEIAPDAKWRPAVGAGATGAWYNVGAAPINVKPEPGLANGNLDSDEESEDEFEELRKAAAALKRGRNQPIDVIELLDSEDDDQVQRPPKKRQTTMATFQPPRPAQQQPPQPPMPMLRQPSPASHANGATGSSGSRGVSGDGVGAQLGGSVANPFAGMPHDPAFGPGSAALVNGLARLNPPAGGSGTLQGAGSLQAAVSPRNLGLTVVQGPQGPTFSVQAMQPSTGRVQPVPAVPPGLAAAASGAPLPAPSFRPQVPPPRPPQPVAARPAPVAARPAAPARAQAIEVIEIDSD